MDPKLIIHQHDWYKNILRGKGIHTGDKRDSVYPCTYSALHILSPFTQVAAFS